MIFLDTHIVIWLYLGEEDYFSERVKAIFAENDLVISPIVLLELQYLHEIKRLHISPKKIVDTLISELPFSLQDVSLADLVGVSLRESWTRDPFDRLIVSHAKFNKMKLITSDRQIAKNFNDAVW